MTFRLATRSDVPAILDLLADDEVSRARDGAVSETADTQHWKAFEAIDADPRNELVGVERDGVVAGTFQLTFTPSLSRGGSERMTIEAVRVRSDLRGQGVGRRMMRWALDRGRERGCRLAQLTTDKRRADAHRFYESLGFAATHEGMKLPL
ncbi:MAG TPA: GNAT family N-acetyltransferase [Actinoplanes sp.]|nr:GNAT family N-acetyltransferase [Actinoplanes sp.]